MTTGLLSRLFQAMDKHAIDLWLVLLALLVFQLQYVHLPHFWDEAWVYAPAVRSMSQRGPSLLPDAIDLGLSRGHPLLFQFLGGCWMKLFGTSNTSAHLFALTLTSGFLSSTYFLFRKHVLRSVALAVLVLLVVQPIFVAQSAMLYPEMLLTWGLILALFGYAYERKGLFALGLSIAIYAKESALVFFVGFLLWDIGRILFLNNSWAVLKRWIIPVAVAASHPLLLYAYHGWFFYPDHMSYISTELEDVRTRMHIVFEFVFHRQNREWVLYPLAIIGVMSLRLKRIWYNVLIVGIGFSAFKVFYGLWKVPGWYFVPAMTIISLLPLVVWYFTRQSKEIRPIHHFMGVGYLIIIGFIVFSGINFYTHRYMLAIIVLACAMGATLLWNSRWLRYWMKLALLCVFAGISVHALLTDQSRGELTLGLYNDLLVQQRMVNWMEEQAARDAVICTSFVTGRYLQDPFSGYVSDSTFFTDPGADICSSDCGDADFIVLTGTTGFCEDIDYNLDHFFMVYSDTLDKSFAVVFARQPE